jgi:hypothetical protein
MPELEAYTAEPAQREEQEVVALSQRVVSATGAVYTIVNEDLPRLNKALNRANLPFITVDSERSEHFCLSPITWASAFRSKANLR